MLYKEVVERIRENRPVSIKDCKGIWFFYLIQDGEIKNVKYNHTLYEVNIIPCGMCDVFYNITDESCQKWGDALHYMEYMLKYLTEQNQSSVYVTIDEEYYKIVVEALETDE